MVEPKMRPNRGMWEPITEDLVMASLLEFEKQVDKKRAMLYEEYENWYLGGSKVEGYLLRNDGERDDSYATRLKRIAHINYIGRIIDEIVDDAYGDEVDRKLGQTAGPDQERRLAEVSELSNMLDIQQETCRTQVLLGDGWIYCSYSEEYQIPVWYPAHPGQIGFWVDRNNPRRIVRLIERRTEQTMVGKDLKDVVEYWIWTPDEYARLDAKWRYIEPPTPHRIGSVPYVRWKGRGIVGEVDGISYARDLVGLNRLLLNRVSDVDKVIRYQTHGLLVIKSVDDQEVKSGADWFIRLSDPDSNAFFISPTANIQAAVDSIEDITKRMFEVGSIPMSLVRGGQASSGLQLAIEMRPLTRVVATVRAKGRVAEAELLKLTCAVGNAYGNGWPDPRTLRPEVRFVENFLPQDKDSEFARDLVMVNNVPPLMTIEKFIRKWTPELLGDEAAIAAYLDELRKQDGGAGYGGSAGGKTSSGSGSTGGETPPSEGGDIPQGVPGETGGDGKIPPLDQG